MPKFQDSPLPVPAAPPPTAAVAVPEVGDTAPVVPTADTTVPEDGGGVPEVEAPAFASVEDAMKEIENLRHENAKRRVQNKELSEVFDKLNPEERHAMLSLTEQIATDPLAAEERLTTILERIRARKGTSEAPATEQETFIEDEDAEPKYLTQADVDRILEERLETAESERQVQQFLEQARALGYEKDSPEYGLLLHYASEADLKGVNDPLQAGHEAVEARNAEIRAEAVEDYKRAVAEGRPETVNTSASTTPPRGPNTALKVEREESKDWNIPRRLAQERLRGARAGETNSVLT